MPVPIEQFGKDHWSLLAYCGCRVVDNNGTINNEHLRCYPPRHPHYVGPRRAAFGRVMPWQDSYGTRLAGFFEASEKKKPEFQLTDHDDWDCLQDLEIAGLVKIHGTGLHPLVKLTDYGYKVEARLRKHKAEGGQFNGFHDVFMVEIKDLKPPKKAKVPKVSIILGPDGDPIPLEEPCDSPPKRRPKSSARKS